MADRITMKDVAAAGYCARGARRWFEAHGFDFAQFLSIGIDASVLEQTGDALALRVLRMMEGVGGR